MKPLDQFYSRLDEPHRSCLLSLKELIMKAAPELTHELKYGMPFFLYQGKMICYLWVHKKFKQPYIGVVDGHLINYPGLLLEKRARMKILLIDPHIDMDASAIHRLISAMMDVRSN